MKLNGWQRIEIIVLMVWTIGAASQARAEETSHLVFVTEYVRELSANEDARAKAEQGLKDAPTANDKQLSSIHASTLIQLEFGSQIDMLRGMHLNSPFDELIPNIVELYQKKISIHQKMIDISSTFLAGPKPDVNYRKMVTDMPKIRAFSDEKIRAFSDEIDHTLFEATPMVFATLIDQRPDSNNHLSHLVITKAEREKLVHDLTVAFGEKLEQKNQNYFVSSASVLKAYLQKGYKCSDEPWQ
jgi:hypothetical protein